LISTLHAAHPGGAIARLLEMGVEPYQITSALFGVVSQRLLRRLRPGADANSPDRYVGRVPIAEHAFVDADLRRAILSRADAETLRDTIARQPGHATLRDAAAALITNGTVDAPEVARVLGA
jgi:type II secretory ATPase GspE/PulE/Tfp pilus assembly ATPase PilB-like protein